MNTSQAEIVQEYGPFPGVEAVHGVTFDGSRVWFAVGDRLNALDPKTGNLVGALEIACHAGSAFDGTHLFQIAESGIQKIDPKSGKVLATIPAPGNGGDSGMAWAEGALWVGQYRERKIHKVDPDTGAILRTIECSRLVTGVTWVDGDLWHGNLVVGPGGRRYLIDPSVAQSNPEQDLAMLDLFGSILSAAQLETIARNAGVGPGFSERIPFWQIYPLLVHVNIIGGSYVRQLTDAVRVYR